jgi:hypothetical protein
MSDALPAVRPTMMRTGRVGSSDARHGRERGRACGQMQKIPAVKFHCGPSLSGRFCMTGKEHCEGRRGPGHDRIPVATGSPQPFRTLIRE